MGNLHFKQIGPVQFSIGQSLNKVEEISVRMTRVVPTRAGAKAGTFGEKNIVRYSFIEFHGFVNNNVAREVDLSEEDVKNMLVAMWKGTNSLSTSSKFGQQSRLLIKVNYKEDGYVFGPSSRRDGGWTRPERSPQRATIAKRSPNGSSA